MPLKLVLLKKEESNTVMNKFSSFFLNLLGSVYFTGPIQLDENGSLIALRPTANYTIKGIFLFLEYNESLNIFQVLKCAHKITDLDLSKKNCQLSFLSLGIIVLSPLLSS